MHLLIGYGNPLRSDDRLGQFLAEELGHSWTVITRTQLTPELAAAISQAERVVFIDASIGETPGEINSERVEPLAAIGAFTHNATPASLLATAQELYDAAPPALMITITGASFEYGVDFSPQIDAMLPHITRTIDRLIADFVGTRHETISELLDLSPVCAPDGQTHRSAPTCVLGGG